MHNFKAILVPRYGWVTDSQPGYGLSMFLTFDSSQPQRSYEMGVSRNRLFLLAIRGKHLSREHTSKTSDDVLENHCALTNVVMGGKNSKLQIMIIITIYYVLLHWLYVAFILLDLLFISGKTRNHRQILLSQTLLEISELTTCKQRPVPRQTFVYCTRGSLWANKWFNEHGYLNSEL